jgi:hypothetical protein
MITNELVQDLLIIILLVAVTPLLGLACLYWISRSSAWGVMK